MNCDFLCIFAFTVMCLRTTHGVMDISTLASCIPDSDILSTTHGVSFLQCLEMCHLQDACDVAFYRRHTTSCAFVANYDVTSTTPCPDGVIVHNESIEKILASLPATCIQDSGDTQTICSTDAFSRCIDVLGNRDVTGSRLIAVCPCEMFQCARVACQCAANGTWQLTDCLSMPTTQTPATPTTAAPVIVSGGRVSQSSVFSPTTYPRRARDGDRSGRWPCAATRRYETAAWWQLDMETVRTVTKVELYFRLDCCTYRFHHILLTVMTDLCSDPVTCAFYQGPPTGASENPVALECSAPSAGRYLKISKQAYDILTLCEVVVYEIL